MKIIVDAMGGDNAPKAPVLGAIQANQEYGVDIILVGRGEEILKVMEESGIKDLPAGVEIAPKKTSFASTGRPSTAYHELELAAMDLLSIIRASKGGANKDLKKMAAQLRAVTEKWKDA